ncbi:MAG: hypothetical protein ABL877_04095 [Thiobacillus sp.]
MERTYDIGLLGLAFAVLIFSGCAGQQTFTASARPGETVAVAAAWNPGLTRAQLSVVITPESGATVTYAPGDTRVRTVFQSYPDPLSKLVVGDRAQVDYPAAGLSNGQGGYNVLSKNFGNWFVRGSAGNENDWANAFVFLDLPQSIPAGLATIDLKVAGTSIVPPTTIEVLPLPAAGTNSFPLSNGIAGPIRSVERAPHYVVRFTGPSGVIPHSIQADFTRTLAATGNAWVTHPRGDIQSAMWSDTGSLIKVMVTPVKGTTTNLLTDFKFYVTGAVTSLGVNSVKAYDIAGNPLTGFNATLQFVNN